MRISRFALLAAVAIAACAPPPPPAPDVKAIGTALEAANAKGVAAMLKGDIPAFMANYESGAVMLMPNAPTMRGADEMTKALTGMLAEITTTKFEPHNVDLIVTGDYAIETGTYTWVIQPKKGKSVTEVGKYLTVWHKQADGGWKIVRDMNNPDAPAK